MTDEELMLSTDDLPVNYDKRGPLTLGEWEALRHQAPRDVLHLVVKLGAHHGAWVMPRNSSECPLCSGKRDKPGQRSLDISET